MPKWFNSRASPSSGPLWVMSTGSIPHEGCLVSLEAKCRARCRVELGDGPDQVVNRPQTCE